jgi:cytochrome c biogenesis protein CcdA
MGSILRSLLWTAAVSRGAGDVRLALRRAGRRTAFVAMAIALGLAGGGFLLAAVFLELADLVGSIRASLIVGAALAVAACGLLFFARARRHRSTVSSDGRGIEPTPVATTMIDIGRDLAAAASRNPGSFVVAGFLIGLVLGRSRR